MLIQDVVMQNDQAAFAHDVQLDWYPNDKRNLPLVRGYMFTGKAIEGKVPSVEMLKTIRDSFLWGSDNRHVVVATFGHGKSHFALALANFFGKPADSPEITTLLERIAHSANASVAEGFRNFKEGRPPLLIVRLRGDLSTNLNQQFTQGLEAAIAEHPAANGTPLPFWFDRAADVFCHFSPEERSRADAYLATHQTDAVGLLQRIENRDATAYDLCVEAATAAKRMRPDFGGETSLQAMVEWAADTFCKEENLLAGGLLILFDEFSAFIQRYAERTVKNGTPLQDLMNGVNNRYGKVTFVAFSQRDPIADARHVYRGGGDNYDSLLKELERLPSSQWHNLYSSLETVLDAYLKQTDAFPDLFDHAASAFVTATDATMQLLKPRYDDEKGWGTELFDTVVSRGCFPLHPLTTGLFCSVELQQVTNARSVLDFVLNELKERLTQDALRDGRPNWVYATALVDCFREMLSERAYREYEEARDQAGPEIPDIQKAILKAILLFGVGGLKLGRVGVAFSQATAHLTGYSPTECDAALEALRAGSYIRYDETRKVYTFWPANSGAAQIEQTLRKELDGKTLESKDVIALNAKNNPLLENKEVNGIDWGHPQEWAAREIILPKRFFNVSTIRRFSPLWHEDAKNGLVEGVRGCIVRVIATNEKEINEIREKAEEVLKEALGDTPFPLIIAIPTDPTPHLATNMLALDILNGWGQEKRKEFSQEAYQDKKKRVEKDIENDFTALRGFYTLVVPETYRADVLGMDAQKKVEKALAVCYRRAYALSPQDYFTNFPSSASSHNSAVKTVCEYLISNSLNTNFSAIEKNKVAFDLLNKYLRPNGKFGWGLVSYTNQIQPPTTARIRQTWDLLEAAFPAGAASVSVKDTLIALLNPPYGYDPHQVALLFCAWCGYNRRDLKMETKSGVYSLADALNGRKSAREFLNYLCHIDPPHISRTDPDATEREVKALLAQMEDATYTISEGRAKARALSVYEKDDNLHADLRKTVLSKMSRLNDNLALAKAYDDEQRDIFYNLSATPPPAWEKLLNFRERISALPLTGSVQEPEWKSKSTLNQMALSLITSALDQRCAKLEKFADLVDFGSNKRSLDSLREQMVSKGFTALIGRIDAALQILQENRVKFEAKQKDREIELSVKAMRDDAPLATLQSHLTELDAFTPLSEDVKAAITKKRAALQSVVGKAEEFVCNLSSRLDAVNTQEKAQELQNEIQRQSYKYHGASQQALIEQASQRCAAIQRALLDLKTTRNTAFQTPEDAERLNAQIGELLTASSAALSREQQSLFPQAKTFLEEKIAAKRAECLQWLAAREKDAEAGIKLDALQTSLLTPPAFLPDEAQARLLAVRHTVSVKLDSEKAEREMRQRDSPIIAQINAMTTDGKLAIMRSNRDRLKELSPSLPDTLTLIQKKQSGLEKAIADAENYVATLTQKSEAVVDAAQARNVEREVERARERYADTPEAAQIEAIAARCKEVEVQFQKHAQEEQERKAKDEPIVAAVRAMPTDANLARLRESLNQLGSYQPTLAETIMLLEKQTEKLRSAVTLAENEAQSFDAKLNDAMSVGRVREIEKEILRVQSRFENTPESELISHALKRCETLTEYLRERDEISRKRPETPQELQTLQNRLSVTHEEAKLYLGSQATINDRAAEALLAHAKKKAEEAVSWLERCQRDAEKMENPSRLLQTLAAPPAFLPPACHAPLEALQVQAQRKIDEDQAGQVVCLFQQIKDTEKRRACLLELQKMMREQEI